MVRRRRERVDPTEQWGQLELLLKWPEQRVYELIRPIVVFGGSVAERARETGAASERTLRRKSDRFDEEGMPSLFGSEPAKYQSATAGDEEAHRRPQGGVQIGRAHV